MALESIKGILKRKPGGLRYRLGVNPSLDWLLIILGFSAFTLFIVLFTLASRPGDEWTNVPAGTNSKESSIIPSQELIDRVVTHCNERRARFDALIATPARLVDPSQ